MKLQYPDYTAELLASDQQLKHRRKPEGKKVKQRHDYRAVQIKKLADKILDLGTESDEARKYINAYSILMRNDHKPINVVKVGWKSVYSIPWNLQHGTVRNLIIASGTDTEADFEIKLKAATEFGG